MGGGKIDHGLPWARTTARAAVFASPPHSLPEQEGTKRAPVIGRRSFQVLGKDKPLVVAGFLFLLC